MQVALSNGVVATKVLQDVLLDSVVWPGTIEFNVAWKEGCVFARGTEGSIDLKSGVPIDPLVQALEQGGLSTRCFKDLRGLQYSKLLVNLINPVLMILIHDNYRSC